MNEQEPFEFDVTKVIRETEKALLVETDDLDEPEVWIPKSQIHDNSEVWRKEQEGRMAISPWFARQKGYVDE